jgi:hypothetical protein
MFLDSSIDEQQKISTKKHNFFVSNYFFGFWNSFEVFFCIFFFSVLKILPVVNLPNILRAAFLPFYLRKKMLKPKLKEQKVSHLTFTQKNCP